MKKWTKEMIINARSSMAGRKVIGMPYAIFLDEGETLPCPEGDFVFTQEFDWHFESMNEEPKKDLYDVTIRKSFAYEPFVAPCPVSGRFLLFIPEEKKVEKSTFKNKPFFKDLYGEEAWRSYQEVLRKFYGT